MKNTHYHKNLMLKRSCRNEVIKGGVLIAGVLALIVGLFLASGTTF